MKRILSVALMALFVASVVGCGGGSPTTPVKSPTPEGSKGGPPGGTHK